MSEDEVEGEFCTDKQSFQTNQTDIDQDRKDEMLEAFTFYDSDCDGLISTRMIATVMRALGQVPTVCEETDIVAEFAIEECNDVDFKAFTKLMTKRMKEVDEDCEFRESFRRFDKKETGMVDVQLLRSMLTTIGEPLTNKEFDEWLGDAEEFIEDGYLKYEDFATAMLSK